MRRQSWILNVYARLSASLCASALRGKGTTKPRCFRALSKGRSRAAAPRFEWVRESAVTNRDVDNNRRCFALRRSGEPPNPLRHPLKGVANSLCGPASSAHSVMPSFSSFRPVDYWVLCGFAFKEN
jgi:hypothetical protein